MMKLNHNIKKKGGTVRRTKEIRGATMESRLWGPAGLGVAALAVFLLLVGLLAVPAWAQAQTTLTVTKSEVAGDETVTVGDELT